MNYLCKYKDILGKPSEGMHSIRIFNIAIIDVIFTIIGAYLLSLYFNFKFSISLLFLFVLSIVFHKLFCVNTTVTKFLFN